VIVRFAFLWLWVIAFCSCRVQPSAVLLCIVESTKEDIMFQGLVKAALPTVAAAAFMALTATSSPAFTLSAPSLDKPTSASNIEQVRVRHRGGGGWRRPWVYGYGSGSGWHRPGLPWFGPWPPFF
jgi:hypothetical protein